MFSEYSFSIKHSLLLITRFYQTGYMHSLIFSQQKAVSEAICRMLKFLPYKTLNLLSTHSLFVISLQHCPKAFVFCLDLTKGFFIQKQLLLCIHVQEKSTNGNQTLCSNFVDNIEKIGCLNTCNKKRLDISIFKKTPNKQFYVIKHY